MKSLARQFAKAGLLLPVVVVGWLLAGSLTMAVSVGEIAPEFEVMTQDGKILRLSDFRGHKPV